MTGVRAQLLAILLLVYPQPCRAVWLATGKFRWVPCDWYGRISEDK